MAHDAEGWGRKKGVLYLFHVLGHRVLLQELCALAGVETLCVSEELTLKVLFVDRQRGALGEGILLVQAQFHCTHTKYGSQVMDPYLPPPRSSKAEGLPTSQETFD